MEDNRESIATLRHFITRGGFIQDRNGRLCKEGDEILFGETKENGVTGILAFNNEKGEFHLVMSFVETPLHFLFDDGESFELIKPCEPDICKDYMEARQ